MTPKECDAFVEKVKELRHAMKEFEKTRIAGWNYQVQRIGAQIDKLLSNL